MFVKKIINKKIFFFLYTHNAYSFLLKIFMFNTETNLYFFKKVFKIIYYLFFVGAHVDV